MKRRGKGTPLVVQRWRLQASNAKDKGLTPGQGTKIQHASQRGQNICILKKKEKKKKEGGKVAPQWRNLANTTLARWSEWTLSVINHVDSMDFWSLCIENDLISVVFFPKTCNTRRTMRKNIRLGNNLQNTWPVLLKTVKIIENKESLRNCYGPEESRETRPLNVI